MQAIFSFSSGLRVVAEADEETNNEEPRAPAETAAEVLRKERRFWRDEFGIKETFQKIAEKVGDGFKDRWKAYAAEYR